MVTGRGANRRGLVRDRLSSRRAGACFFKIRTGTANAYQAQPDRGECGQKAIFQRFSSFLPPLLCRRLPHRIPPCQMNAQSKSQDASKLDRIGPYDYESDLAHCP